MTFRHHAEMDLSFEVSPGRAPRGLVESAQDATLWHPDATLVTPADGHNGLTFAPGYPARGLLHITVSKTYSPSKASYFGNPYWPHATVTTSAIYQHLPLNVGAYALAHEYGPETNRANCIQVEVVWDNAADANMPDALLRNLASWVKFVSEALDIPYEFAEMYRPGVVLASVGSPIRMSDARWTAFHGWCAHSNVPGGNDHWDANFDVARLMAFIRPAPPVPPPTEEFTLFMFEYPQETGYWLSDGIVRRPTNAPQFWLDCGAAKRIPTPSKGVFEELTDSRLLLQGVTAGRIEAVSTANNVVAAITAAVRR